MLGGRQAFWGGAGAEETWEQAGLGPQGGLEQPECSWAQWRFGDGWKFFTSGRGQPEHCLEFLILFMLCMIKWEKTLKLFMPLKVEWKEKYDRRLNRI